MSTVSGPRAPSRFNDPKELAHWLVQQLGAHLVVGTPIGVGKPVRILNALYDLACEEPLVELHILTGLSIDPPRAPPLGLGRRLAEPILARSFAGPPPLHYLRDRSRGELPPNIRVEEFFLQPSTQHPPAARQGYVSSNYSLAGRDLCARGINVLAQLVTPSDDEATLSMATNTSLSLDILDYLQARADAGERTAVVGELNRQLPYMFGESEARWEELDAVLEEDPHRPYEVMGPPNAPVELRDHALALHASTLVEDGGTLQVGIGEAGAALAHALSLRHRHNDLYREMVRALGHPHGTLGPFRHGLYASTEMLVDGLVHLLQAGVIRRRVYDDAALQELVNRGVLSWQLEDDVLERLHRAGAVSAPLTTEEVWRLVRWGVLREEVRLRDDRLWRGEEESCSPHPQAVPPSFLGETLHGGVLIHAGFVLGPRPFYQALRNMPPEQRQLIHMARIGFVNTLQGDQRLKVAQRQRARFFNSALMVTLDGAVVADGLEDGRVISGVGGQFDFVLMGHQLPGARSITMVPSTHASGSSNIRSSYGHTTIPRHLRDIVVTEYGVADLRGENDRTVAERLIAVAAAPAQGALLEAGRARGVLPADFSLPDAYRLNTPEKLERKLGGFRKAGYLPAAPYPGGLEPAELVWAQAFARLRQESWRGHLRHLPRLTSLLRSPADTEALLDRLALRHPKTLGDHAQAWLARYALTFLTPSERWHGLEPTPAAPAQLRNSTHPPGDHAP